MNIFQSTTTQLPCHQIGLLKYDNRFFRPRVNRVVFQRELKGGVKRSDSINDKQHSHAVYHIFLVHKGIACVMLKGQCLELKERQLLAISPGELHHVLVDCKSCNYSALTFDYLHDSENDPLILPLQDVLSILVGKRLNVIDPWPVVDASTYYDQLHSDFCELYQKAYMSTENAALALLHFLLDFSQSLLTLHNERSNSINSQVQEVKKYIHHNYNKPLDLDCLAELFGYSRRTLTRQFQKVYHTSPIALQIHLRLEAAKLMLSTSHMQIKEISAETGYSDVYQFSRAFSKKWGKSPSEYRENQLNK